MSEAIWVELGPQRYPILVEVGGADSVAAHVTRVAPTGRYVLLTDDNVRPHAEGVLHALQSGGADARLLCVTPGEGSKSIETIGRLWEETLAGDIDRGDTIVPIGGGVVGDLGGFLASTVLRGIRCVQVATSVLAMADASIGGKTGINLSHGKNLVGTFHQPAAVIQWVGALGTLELRELRSGLAEVTKSALLSSEEAFSWVESHASAMADGDPEAVVGAVSLAARLKADIVGRDAREGGVRKLLNLGHTLGHVIEHAAGYGVWTHGEAVSAGIVLALDFGLSQGIGTKDLRDRVVETLRLQKLPVSPPSLTLDAWAKPLRVDKKRAGERIEFVLCDGPGACRLVPIELAAAVEWLKTLC